jgi:transposase
LQQFASSLPEDLPILQLDNGPFHQAENLVIPPNIVLLFQPPHCPELNRIERLWEYLKSFLSWQVFDNLEELRAKVRTLLNYLSQQLLFSLTGWDYILQALSVAGI